MTIETIERTFVREYRGNQDVAYADFGVDADDFAGRGWIPSTQEWVLAASPGLIAGLAWLAWRGLRRPGALFVTYRGPAGSSTPPERFEDWVYRLGVYDARRELDHELREHAISRSMYAERIADIDRLGLD